MKKILFVIALFSFAIVACDNDDTNIDNDPYIKVSKDTVNVAFNDTLAHVVKVESNVKWVVSGYDNAWCKVYFKTNDSINLVDTINTVKPNLSDSIAIVLSQNTQQSERLTTITLKAEGAISKTIVVKQSAIPASQKLLIYKIISTSVHITAPDITNKDTTTYTYDNMNRIVEINYTTYTNDFGGSEIKKLTYTGDKISEIEIKNTFNNTTQHITYVYEGNKISLFRDNVPFGFANLNEKGQVEHTDYGYTFTYDKDGNIADQELDGKYTTYKYDNKNGVFSGTSTPLWWVKLETRNNNIFNVLHHWLDHTVNNATEKREGAKNIIYTYTYNNEGYPVTFTNNLETAKGVEITEEIKFEYVKVK